MLKTELDITPQDLGITPQVEFYGHCSNLKTWFDLHYDTRVIHSNLAFSLLKALTEAGDPQAQNVFREEIVKRFLDGYIPVSIFLMKEGYIDYLNDKEFSFLSEKFQDLIDEPEALQENESLAKIWNKFSLISHKRMERKPKP